MLRLDSHSSGGGGMAASRSALAAATALALAFGSVAAAEEAAPANEPPVPMPHFRDATAEAGIDFTYYPGATGKHYIVETMGGGAALFDYDGDGDLDLYLVQGAALADGREPLLPPPAPLVDRLLRNDLEVGADGSRRLRFTDVTEEAELTARGYGTAVAAGDVDGDGHVDLYIARFGPNQLLRNRGDGTFEEITGAAGGEETRWSLAATFFDADGDDDLDLYVANYLEYSLATNKECFSPTGAADYCGPQSYPGATDRLFLNLGVAGGGPLRFEDASTASGIAAKPGNGMGVVASDLDLDGRVDLYVGNDQMANLLWLNQGPGEEGRPRFSDEALLGGCGVNGEGKAEASMGIAAADGDGDGDDDLFLTHLNQETNTLYLNDGRALFDDATLEAGLASPSWSHTGFGTAFLDFDLDGDLDLFVANGAVRLWDNQRRRRAGEAAATDDPVRRLYPLDQPNQLFENRGNRGDGRPVPRFVEVTAAAGDAFALSEISRGAALGDVDNDGDPDLVVVNAYGPARLLLAQAPPDRPWIGLRLVDESGRRDLPASRAALLFADRPPRWRTVQPGGGYASAHDPRLVFGLGDAARPTAVEVHWPDGRRERFPPPPTNRYSTLRRGTGTPLDAVPDGEATP